MRKGRKDEKRKGGITKLQKKERRKGEKERR